MADVTNIDAARATPEVAFENTPGIVAKTEGAIKSSLESRYPGKGERFFDEIQQRLAHFETHVRDTDQAENQKPTNPDWNAMRAAGDIHKLMKETGWGEKLTDAELGLLLRRGFAAAEIKAEKYKPAPEP